MVEDVPVADGVAEIVAADLVDLAAAAQAVEEQVVDGK
jgi:hypothetical protein